LKENIKCSTITYQERGDQEKSQAMSL